MTDTKHQTDVRSNQRHEAIPIPRNAYNKGVYDLFWRCEMLQGCAGVGTSTHVNVLWILYAYQQAPSWRWAMLLEQSVGSTFFFIED